MRSVRQRGTAPERITRSILHRLGYRFRLHRRDLPGTPDIVLPRFRTVIFVHGCFWHRHLGCKMTTVPKTRPDFWSEKFAANMARDERKAAQLKGLGWTVRTIWECETRKPAALEAKLDSWFRPPTVSKRRHELNS
jgi:DNA mismatch endonuclease (patch repair protein)